MTSPTRARPRVLYVTYVTPWRPRYGGTMRCLGVLRGLAGRAEVHVALASSDRNSIAEFLTRCSMDGVELHVLGQDPGWEEVDEWRGSRSARVWIGHNRYRSALRLLEHRIEPDVVWYFETESLRRAGWPARRYTVLDHCDVRWRTHMRAARLERGGRRVRGLLRAAAVGMEEVTSALRANVSLVAAAEETRCLWPARNVTVLPNGFDFPDELPQRTARGLRLVFFGSLFYPPNADGISWFCREVWPLIMADSPSCHLDVVGLGDELVTEVTNTVGTEFHGYVQSLATVVDRAAALVVPLRVGGGTRIKILEAWSMGLPVVSTTIGAEGLGVQGSKSALVADSPQALANQCLAVLRDPELRNRLALAGFDYGREHFSWTKIHELLDPILADCFTENQASAN